VEVAFSHWSASWPVLIGYAVVAAAQLAGLRRLLSGGAAVLPDGATRLELLREAVLFHLGLLLVLLALVSPVGYWSDVYIWVRALQQLLVAVVGPGLIVLGAPWLAFRQLMPGGARQGQASWLVARPLLMVVAFNLVWLGWQLPVLFDLARGNSLAALAEHASYLTAGVLLWLQFSGSRPLSPRATPLRRMAMLVGTVMTMTVLGMVLVFGNGVLYPAYAGPAHQVMTVLDDQQLAGAVLWMGILPSLIVVGVALLMQWLNNEESAELSAGLDRLIAPRKYAWPSRPVIR
jgi:putative membrane protein